MRSPFDRALEAQMLADAADQYAARRGAPGSRTYRLAWLQFRERARTIEDLEAWRLRSAGHERSVRILRAMMMRAQRIDATPMATAQLLDRRTGHLRLVAQAGFAPEFCDYFKVVEHGSCACGSALANRDAVWVGDAQRSDVFNGSEALEVILRGGSKACASVPVTAPDGEIVAMISTHHSSPASWGEDRKRDLTRLALSAGVLLQPVGAAAPARS